MSGVPDLPKGQLYNVKCCHCGSKTLVRGMIQIHEPEGETWGPNEVGIEYQCERLTCKQVSYLILRHAQEGTTLQWRSFKNTAVKTVLS